MHWGEEASRGMNVWMIFERAEGDEEFCICLNSQVFGSRAKVSAWFQGRMTNKRHETRRVNAC